MATPSGYRVQFDGQLVGRALNAYENVIGVVLGDLVIDGRRIHHRNAMCTPARAFDQIGSFEKGRVTGNAQFHRDGNGDIRLTDCRWVELSDVAALPVPAPMDG